MEKPTAVTCDDCAVAELITPEDTPADAVGSVSVCTVMPVALPAVAAPIVRPLRVIVKVVPAAIPATAVVMTIEVAPGAAEVAVMMATEVELLQSQRAPVVRLMGQRIQKGSSG
jgi:hypothetical protein